MMFSFGVYPFLERFVRLRRASHFFSRAREKVTKERGSFSLGYFSLTPGILPPALRASFAVPMRILRMRGQAKAK